MNKALLLVDVQNDFCPPDGSLAVKDGDKIVVPINVLLPFFQRDCNRLVASMDWHPPVTKHFAKDGGKWPVHCVRNTYGAELHDRIDWDPPTGRVFFKGFKKDSDDFSAFDGVNAEFVGLEEWLKSSGVKDLYVCGLATDYCVWATVVDAIGRGFNVTVVTDAIKAVDLNPGDGQKALDGMKGMGARLLTTVEVLNELA